MQLVYNNNNNNNNDTPSETISIKQLYDILKTLPFKYFVKVDDFKLCLNILIYLDCFDGKGSEFHQSIDLYKNDDKT